VTEQLAWDETDTRPRRREAAEPRQTWTRGRARGRLVAANLATLAGDVRAGLVARDWADRVVFLEESDTASWEAFTGHLATVAGSGLLDGAAALVFGRFRQVCLGEWAAGALRDVLAPLARRTRGPVVAGVEFGHTDPVLTLPIGGDVEVVADPDGVRLLLHGPATRETR
jgi:muramoyltetrapeptide carboxypeptidase